jgi:hypothetical protein
LVVKPLFDGRIPFNAIFRLIADGLLRRLDRCLLGCIRGRLRVDQVLLSLFERFLGFAFGASGSG